MDDLELLGDFVEEAREHLGDIEIQLLQIEAMGEAIDDNLVNTVFRAIHSVKGAAGFLGLTQINAVSHRLEDVLGKVREKQLVPDPFNVDVMLKAADRLKSMIESIETSNATDNTLICAKLDAILKGLSNTSAGPVETVSTPTGQDSSEPQPAKRASRKKTTRPKTTNKAGASKNQAESQGESSAQSTPTRRSGSAAQPKTPAPKSRPKVQAHKETSPAELSDRVSDSLDQIDSALASAAAPSGPSCDAVPTNKSLAADPTVRVGVRVLDRLMNLAGELVLSRNQLMQAIASKQSERREETTVRRRADSSSKLDAIASGLDQVTTELQETIMQTRMQPIGNVFSKFPRLIRDLSASLGKEINLKTEGNEVETDKTIIEAIADPLTHLVRNSCDHGVEKPETRKAAGKPPAGTVVLRAYHQAGKVMIEITDDGAGINPNVLKSKAIEKGILTAEAASRMNDREAVNLIFAPGFSTAAAITAVSGRGVGMDVVRTNIEKIGGSVEVKSQFGKGSTVQITLPLTLAIVPSMIVSVDGRPYALPQSGIVELVQPDGKDKSIGRAGSAEVLRLRGHLLPLIRLHELLSVRPSSALDSVKTPDEIPAGDDRQLVVVESARNRFALAVDRVLDSEEIVVKPLGRHLSNLSLLAGSTILGDGRVALILDAAGIASRISLAGEKDPADENDMLGLAKATDHQRLVLLSTSEQDRFAVSMDIVSRIERVPVGRVEQLGKHRLLQYRGTTLPLLSVQDGVDVTGVDETDHLYVIVFKVYGREVGLLAPHLHDIRDCDLSTGVENSGEVGVAGIAVIDDRATRLLDLYGLTEVARPEWFSQPEEVERSGPARVLVCEDSAFFRTFLVRTLLEEGHEVTACEDGEEGWVTLTERPTDFDLLLTDIEMPELNGFELTRRVRADGRFDRLPVIALTSLADDQSTRLGKEVGVSDYQVKMNKPELLASIHRLVGHARCQQNRGSQRAGMTAPLSDSSPTQSSSTSQKVVH